MRHRLRQLAVGVIVLMLGALSALSALSARAQVPPDRLRDLASGIAAQLAAACPRAAADDVAAHTACTSALRAMTALPLAPAIAWGGDQPDRKLARKKLTHFQSELFRTLYLSLYWFDGSWSVDHDARDDLDVIRIGAFFRNRLPPGEFPYPFWHSADKWSAYETSNQISLYVDGGGQVVALTRGTGGDEAARGEQLVHQVPPAFDGRWLWTDADGQPQPKVSLFASKYRADNPFLTPLDEAYRAMAMELREGSCMRCHAPSNRAGADRLVLLQTPAHAAAEIGAVLKAVRAGDMPQNDWGEKKPLDPQMREALLGRGEAFSALLAEADRWEAATRRP